MTTCLFEDMSKLSAGESRNTFPEHTFLARDIRMDRMASHETNAAIEGSPSLGKNQLNLHAFKIVQKDSIRLVSRENQPHVLTR